MGITIGGFITLLIAGIVIIAVTIIYRNTISALFKFIFYFFGALIAYTGLAGLLTVKVDTTAMIQLSLAMLA